ncbi:band 4.1-like protein 2 isoform X8 [Amblyraja radiata]|uniref:band 4.1-like protein 2 isoform X8 n=1 Tax=Amblyraja radiata TaxID=386614 RepID=UPI0014026AF2|nr:band 4.1-like protein 2 isoform X8 [Amblyraja radiata]
MTTEVGSAIQVNEESKGTEPDDSEASNPDKTSNGNEEAEKEIQEDEQPESTTQPLKEQEFNSSISDASTQSTPSSSDKKDPTGGKGLFRFLPGWLKKPKSMSQVETTEEKEAEEDIQTKDRNSEDEQPELMKSTSENEVVKGMETEESKTDEIVEQYSLNSAELQTDLQTDKAKKPEESLEKDADMDNEEVVLDEKKDENSKDGEVWKDEDASKKSPLKIPKKIKFMQSKVFMLDGSEFTYEIEKHAKGQIMLDKVCEQINLLEKDYFGLTFRDATGEKNWLDPAKEIKKQIRSCAWHFNFNVKFYPPDPSQLTEDITRYYLCLQLRQDIVSGRLPCSFVTHALLGSCALQAELGDYDANEHKAGYVTELQFSPNQTKELEEKISELHKTHRGLTPAQADAQFLENAKMLSMYGVDLHHAKDSEGVDIMLGVCANGLLIYKDRLRINRFAWPKILKISYKRSNFYIKIRPGEIEQFESTIGFKLPNHRAAKRLWKVCVEHHTFFRLLSPEQTPKSKFMTLGSKFRYSGRTQAQTREASILIDRPAPFFERTSSKRMSRSLDGVPAGGINEVGLQQESSCLSSTADGVKTEADALAIKDITTSLKASQLEMPVETKTEQDEITPRKEKSLEEEITSLLLSKESFSTGLVASFSSTVSQALEDAGLKEKAAAESVSLIDSKQLPETSDENQKSEMEEQAEVIVEEAIVIEEVKSAPGHSKVKLESPVENSSIVPPVELAAKESNVSSSDSRSDSEEEAEYHPQTKEGENVKRDQNECKTLTTVAMDSEISVTDIEEVHFPVTVVHKMQDVLEEDLQEMQNGKLQEAKQEHEDINPKLNGDVSFIDSDAMPEVVCYAEPPVVKTEMVTISDTVSPDKTEIATKEVPIVQTETKTITYEAAQGDGSGDNDPGVLMSAQTITSESFCQTMTTQITKTVKGGVSETRIEKRIVITGDTDIDHDQALAQAIKEAKEQHPDMSVTRVVVHKETELTEDGDE